jgi:TonB family protein
MRFHIASTSLALVWSSIATPVAASVLQPIDNWNLDYGSTQCAAARSFGTASNPIVFGIVPSLSGNSYELLVSLPRPGPTFAHESRGTVDFGRGAIDSGLLSYGGKGVQLSVLQFRIGAAQMEQVRSASMVSLRSENGDRYTFALSDGPALLDGLRKCTADLQQYWNMDGRMSLDVAKAATGDIRSIFTASDYPTEALMRQQQGTPQYQLLVDGSGVVAGCDVFASSGAPALDAAGCEVIREKAKFSPATDNQGAPVRSVITTPPVVWEIGDRQVFDNGCRTLTSNTDTLVSMCERARAEPPPKHIMQPIVATQKAQ